MNSAVNNFKSRIKNILEENGIDKKDLTIDTSVAFSAMSSAFISGTGDFVSLFEPNALQLEKENKGYVVASLGELGGNIPYTSYSARDSYIKNNEDVIKSFTKAVQMGLDFVWGNDSETVAKSIISFFPDTTIDDLTKIIDRYKNMEAWPRTTNFTKESFDHMQDIMINAEQLKEKVSFENLSYKVIDE